MKTINFTINDEQYRGEFREHDNILDSVAYTPQLPWDVQTNGYMHELLTNGLYEGGAQPGDDYSMVLYKMHGTGAGLQLTWEHMWNNGEDRPLGAIVERSLNVVIQSSVDDDLSHIKGVQKYKYACDAASMVISSGGFRTYFGNNVGDGEYPIYYTQDPKLIPRDLKNGEYRHIGMFELTEGDEPASAYIESYDCKFMGTEKELTLPGRYAVYCQKEGGAMLIEWWGE